MNYHEHGADDLARLLLSRGIGVEVGVWDGGAAQRLVRDGLGRRCLRVVIEPMEKELEAAIQTVREIEGVLDAAGLRVPRLLHGAGPTTWPLLSLAVERGYAARIGLEDTLEMPDGAPAPDNAALIRAAGRLLAGGGSGR